MIIEVSRAPVLLQLSKKLSRRIHARNKKCFSNTYHVVSHRQEFLYVEGFIIIPSLLGKFPFHHAWAESSEGIVEPTPEIIKTHATGDSVIYHPIIRQSYDELLEFLNSDVGEHALPIRYNSKKYRSRFMKAEMQLLGVR